MQGSIKSFFGGVSLSVIKLPQIDSRVNCTCMSLHATKIESMKMDLEIKWQLERFEVEYRPELAIQVLETIWSEK